jgi:hypothetical protein
MVSDQIHVVRGVSWVFEACCCSDWILCEVYSRKGKEFGVKAGVEVETGRRSVDASFSVAMPLILLEY